MKKLGAFPSLLLVSLIVSPFAYSQDGQSPEQGKLQQEEVKVILLWMVEIGLGLIILLGAGFG